MSEANHMSETTITNRKGMRTPLWERLARDWIAGSASGTILDLRALAGPIFYTWSEEDLMESGILGAATHAVERLEGVRIPAGDEVRALRIVRGLRQNEEGAWPPPGYVVEVLEEQARLWDEEEEGHEAEGMRQRAEGRGQEAEGRGQEAEGGGQTAEGRGHEALDPGLTKYWLAHYVDGPLCLCTLCGNSGVVDTRKTAVSPLGARAGRVNFCICPNGRAERAASDSKNVADPWIERVAVDSVRIDGKPVDLGAWCEEEIDADVQARCKATARRARLADWAEGLEEALQKASGKGDEWPPLEGARVKVALTHWGESPGKPMTDCASNVFLAWGAEI